MYATTSATLISQIKISDWVQIGSTLVLAATAYIAPYLIEKWKFTYRSPNLKIKFKLIPPDCHLTHWNENGIKSPVYYFRFLVENIGKTQAESCEVYLEKIYKENSAGEMIEDQNFTPLNLKWSGLRDPIARTIQPGKEMFCDIGRIHHPSHNYKSVYQNISRRDQNLNKFAFELPERYYSQWDCLIPGNYIIVISVYSKNAKKVTKKFNISWSGKWEDNEVNMFNELVIH